MDAFYASVEQRDFPELKGLPVVVGGRPDSRSVVCTASYEARKFGIHSAMPCSQAYRLCPDAVFVAPRFSIYKEVSKQIHSIFYRYTDLVEPLSLDEAYLDVTVNKLNLPYAVTVAKQIQKSIFDETKLTASAGVSTGKFLAKIASGLKKPNGLTVILPEQSIEFLEKLPIGDFYGVGKVTERRMKENGIFTGADLKKRSSSELESLFGKVGLHYYQLVRGIDTAPVVPFRERKSVSIEDTFSEDISNLLIIESHLKELSTDLSQRLLHHGKVGRTITVKIKYSNFEQHTKSESSSDFTASAEQLFAVGNRLLRSMLENDRPIRLLGIGMSGFDVKNMNPKNNRGNRIVDYSQVDNNQLYLFG